MKHVQYIYRFIYYMWSKKNPHSSKNLPRPSKKPLQKPHHTKAPQKLFSLKKKKILSHIHIPLVQKKKKVAQKMFYVWVTRTVIDVSGRRIDIDDNFERS